MPVMSGLRDKTHIILYALLAAFLALIVFEWGMNFAGFTGSKERLAGKVNGKPIPYREYDDTYKAISENFRRSNPGEEVTSEMELGMQEKAWNIVVDQVLLEQQFEKFGITLQDPEVLDALNSPNPPAVIRQYFTDPATGILDRKKLDSARRDPRNKELWMQIEKDVRVELKVNKLIRVFQTLDRLGDREVADMLNRKFLRFSASFIPLSLSMAGSDGSFPVTGDEIKKYYDSHKELFKQETPSRKADFVFFPLVPSSKDSLAVRKELESIRADFSKAVNDSEYVKVQSDRSAGINVAYSRADFSPAAWAAVFGSSNRQSGTIIGPVADHGEYRLIKIKKVISSPQPIARASHILLRFNPASKDEVQKVRELTMLVYKELQAGVPFEELAKKYSADPGSASNGGDIGWFSKDRMLPAFSAAVFNARPGTVTGPVQTQFGIHIIKVAGFDNSAIVCSEIVRNIRPSSETVDSARRLAMAFQINAKEKGIEKSAASEGHHVEKTGEFVRHMAIPQIGYNEKVMEYAFKAKEGDLSDVIETEKGFYVMRLTSKNDSGYHLLDQEVKTRISAELLREKKETFLKNKLATLSRKPGLTLEKMAEAAGSRVVTADSIRWADGFIPGYGVDRMLVEAISGLVPGKLSKPVKTSDGCAIVLPGKKIFPEGVDVKAEKSAIAPQLFRVKQQQLIGDYMRSLRKVEDLRP